MTQRPYRCSACHRGWCVFTRLGLVVVLTRCVFCGSSAIVPGAYRCLAPAA